MSRSDSLRRSVTRFLTTLILLAGTATMLSACNTIHGAGQDISNTWNAITG